MAHRAFIRSIGRWPCPRDPSPTNSSGAWSKAAVQNPFLESVQTIAELTGVSVSKRSLEEILPDAAQDFDAFYRQRSAAHATGSILVAAVDGKGIPMVKPGAAQLTARLTKGQKANKKRMA